MISRRQVKQSNVTLKADYKKIALEKTRECLKLSDNLRKTTKQLKELKEALNKIKGK